MAFEIKSMALGGTLREAPWLLTVIALAGMTLTSRSACQAPTNANSLVQDGQRQLDEGRSTLEVSTLSTARGLFEECVRRNRNNSVCFYGLARTALYLARAEEAQKDKDSAKKWRDTSITDVRHAIELNDRMADARALLADLYGAKITGMLSGIQFGPKANAEIQRAFQLDPGNAQAFAVVGRKYLYAPRGFGGDLDKAIDSFRKAVALDPRKDENFVWLAIAYRKKGDSESAKAALSEALQLNSRSVFALRVNSGATE
jgi:tetratricopeptide (TPR) repeat protein